MKKILYIITIVFVFNIFCGASSNSHKVSFSEMQKDNSEFYKKCTKIADTFKYDNKFNVYIKSSCMEFEYDRKRLVESIYPKKLETVPNYLDNVQTYRLDYSKRLNAEKLKSYKPIINEYCKLHTKNNPDAQQACKDVKLLF